jgi:hypothetical protein
MQTKASIFAKKLKPIVLLEHSFEPLNRKLPARQGFRGLKSTGPCIECKAIQPHLHPEKLKIPITHWYRHPDFSQRIKPCVIFAIIRQGQKGQKFRTGWYQKWIELVPVPFANHLSQMLLLAGHWMRAFMRALLAVSFARHV